MADGDAFGSNEDLLDEQAQNPLSLRDGRGVRGFRQPGEEAFEVLGELEVGVAVDELEALRVLKRRLSDVV